jgi:pimeloyl-ACP methyl ester carboxylesterase
MLIAAPFGVVCVGVGFPGLVRHCALPDGRVVEIWDGGDLSGRPVIMQPGTPATALAGRWGHEAAHQAGVRLIAVSRPGYGASTPREVPSLRGVGEDTAALATAIGLEAYAVVGVSGGGPFAVAAAGVDPDRVRALGVVGGIGPWRELDEPGELDMVDRESLALLDQGDVLAAHAAVMRQAEEEFGGWRALSDVERADAVLADWDTPGSQIAQNPEWRALLADNLAAVMGSLEGYVFDNLAWGGQWDVDRRDVKVPSIVFDSDQPDVHASWYADGIQAADLVVYPGDYHLDVCDGHWPEVFATLLQIWR